MYICIAVDIKSFYTVQAFLYLIHIYVQVGGDLITLTKLNKAGVLAVFHPWG